MINQQKPVDNLQHKTWRLLVLQENEYVGLFGLILYV